MKSLFTVNIVRIQIEVDFSKVCRDLGILATIFNLYVVVTSENGLNEGRTVCRYWKIIVKVAAMALFTRDILTHNIAIKRYGDKRYF